MMDYFDLIDPTHAKVIIDPDSGFPIGVEHVFLNSDDDLVEFMSNVLTARTTKCTRMNSAYGGHGGSSRSHAAIMLTLVRRDNDTDEVCKSVLNIVDLAGAERPSSNGYGGTSAYKYAAGNFSMVVAAQGIVVNYELSCLRTAIVQATEIHRRRKKYYPPRQLATAFVQYASGCFTGVNQLGMIVTLSPAPSSGWETWFSCKYGEDLAGLRVPVQKCETINRKQALSNAQKLVDKARSSLAKSKPSGHPSSKYYTRRRLELIQAEMELHALQKLCSL